MKVYICGSVGSGKTAVAKRLSALTGWPNWSLDDITWLRRQNTEYKRSEAARIARVNEICDRQDFIVEGAQLGWIGRTRLIAEADFVILLEPAPLIVRWRIDSRFIKQCLHCEQAAYSPTWHLLKDMHRWQRDYNQTDKYKIRKLAANVHNTPIICRNFNAVWQVVQETLN